MIVADQNHLRAESDALTAHSLWVRTTRTNVHPLECQRKLRQTIQMEMLFRFFAIILSFIRTYSSILFAFSPTSLLPLRNIQSNTETFREM
jgi:hypothetical protein